MPHTGVLYLRAIHRCFPLDSLESHRVFSLLTLSDLVQTEVGRMGQKVEAQAGEGGLNSSGCRDSRPMRALSAGVR